MADKKRCANCGGPLPAKPIKGQMGMLYDSEKCMKAHQKRKVCEFC